VIISIVMWMCTKTHSCSNRIVIKTRAPNCTRSALYQLPKLKLWYAFNHPWSACPLYLLYVILYFPWWNKFSDYYNTNLQPLDEEGT
jgi:hypothetical protein